MDLFLELVIKVIPLYTLIGLGVIAGRKANVKKESVVNLLIYFVEPAVVLLSIAGSNFDISYIGLPLLTFLLCFPLAFLVQFIGRRAWKDNTPNLLFFATSTPNTLFFGLPIVLATLGQEMVAVYVLTQMGLYFFTFTIGYYMLARGNFTVADSFKKLISLPVVWALFIGFSFGFVEINMHDVILTYKDYLIGTMVILGMMIVGLALSESSDFKFDWKIMSALFAIRYLLWPVALFAIITIDKIFFGFYSDQIHKMLLILGVLPMAISFVTYAIQTGVQPAVAATAVLITSLFSLFYIPIIFGFFL